MSFPNHGKRSVRPVHPGEILREEFFPDFGLTATKLAEAICVSRQTVNEILRERRALSPEMALRLSKYFNTTPEFWLNCQRAVDLWDASNEIKDDMERIKPLHAA